MHNNDLIEKLRLEDGSSYAAGLMQLAANRIKLMLPVVHAAQAVCGMGTAEDFANLRKAVHIFETTSQKNTDD